MSAEDQSPPPPDAGGGISRRTLLKAGAGVATVGAVTTRPGSLEAIGEASALTVPVETKYTVAGAFVAGPAGAVAGLWLGTKISGYQDAISSAIAADEVEAHAKCTTAMESIGRQVVQINNTLTASTTMGHQEARDAIADAWEAGETASTALSNAHTRINQYYSERPEHNWLVEVAAHLQEIAYGMHGAVEALVEGGSYNRDSSNPWTAGIVNHPTYGDSSFTELIPSTNTTDLTLLDGSTLTLEFPDLRIIWDSSDTSTGDADVTVNVGEWLVGHTSETNDLTLDIDGETATWDLDLSVPNVTNDDGEDLPGKTVFYQRDAVGVREDIKSQAQTVVDGYSQTFVDNLYSALDDGTIDPNDIRGIDGTAQHLAGTEDAYSDAYIISLMNQLGLEQMNLSSIASMTVGYRGFTGQRADDSNGSREIYPDAHTDSASWKGLLFAESVPSALESGKTYACDPGLYTGSWDDTFKSLSTADGSENWSYNHGSGNTSALAVGPVGSTVYAGFSDGYAKALDPTTGSVIWSVSTFGGNDVNGLAASPDGSTVYVAAYDNSVTALATSDGTEQWSVSLHSSPVNGVAVAPDGSAVYTVSDDNTAKSISPSDGTENWSVSPSSNSITGVAVSPDGSTVYVGNDGNAVVALAASDGTEQWSVSPHSSPVETVDVAPDGTVLSAGQDNSVRALAASDGTEQWSNTNHSSTVNQIAVGPAGSTVYTASDDGSTKALATPDGTEQWSVSPHSNNVTAVAAAFGNRFDLSIVGTISDAYFYDGENDEQYRLYGGLLTIDNMTDQDGNDISTTDSGDVGTPDWGQTDITQYSEYLDLVDQIRETIIDNYDAPEDTVVGGSTDSSWWPPSFWPSWLPNDPIGAAVLAILGLAGLNAVTS